MLQSSTTLSAPPFEAHTFGLDGMWGGVIAPMLCFSLANGGRAIGIDADEAGIDLLLTTLTKLRGSGGHVHLRAPSCGGDELAEKTPFGDPAVTEVIIGHGGENP